MLKLKSILFPVMTKSLAAWILMVPAFPRRSQTQAKLSNYTKSTEEELNWTEPKQWRVGGRGLGRAHRPRAHTDTTEGQ